MTTTNVFLSSTTPDYVPNAIATRLDIRVLLDAESIADSGLYSIRPAIGHYRGNTEHSNVLSFHAQAGELLSLVSGMVNELKQECALIVSDVEFANSTRVYRNEAKPWNTDYTEDASGAYVFNASKFGTHYAAFIAADGTVTPL